MGMTWRGDAFLSDVQRKMRQRYKKVGMFIVADIKKTFPGRGSSGLASAGARFIRSEPGEIPSIQTGTLKRTITMEMDPLLPKVFVGTNSPYGLPLEIGTSKMEPRPFLRPSLLRNKRAIIRIISTGKL